MGQHHLDRLRALERRSAGECLVQDDAQRVDVGPFIKGHIALGVLWGHVQRGAQNVAGLGQLHGAGARVHLGDAEVHDLDHCPLALASEEDVLWLEVAVDDPCLVGGLQRRGHVQRHRDGDVDFRRPLAQELTEILPLQQLHDQVDPPVGGLVEVDDLDDARVLDVAGGDRLSFQPPHILRARGDLPSQHLRGVPLLHPEVFNLVDGTHPAGADRTDHPVVGPEHGAGDQDVLDVKDVLGGLEGPLHGGHL